MMEMGDLSATTADLAPIMAERLQHPCLQEDFWSKGDCSRLILRFSQVDSVNDKS